jgi:oligopeptide/dipeptide ABC transporter ATP-binding protein
LVNNSDLDEYLLLTDDVKKYFKIGRAYCKAVDGVSIAIRGGETFGLVGESGCGKSTLSQVVMRLAGPIKGSVYFKGLDIYKLRGRKLREVRRQMQIIFQDPYDSLDPRMTLEKIVTEPLKIHRIGTKQEQQERVRQLFKLVGLPAQQLNRYPHQLSGGQRQRVSIARALALEPEFLICDEAVSALDVSIQSQILNLLSDLKKDLGLTYMFVSHDLSVVRHIADRIGVMYFGRLLESGSKRAIFGNCLHPYTFALLSAVPNPNPAHKSERALLQGDVPSLLNPPSGCIFHERCAYCELRCKTETPRLRDMGDDHWVACHRADCLDLSAAVKEVLQ